MDEEIAKWAAEYVPRLQKERDALLSALERATELLEATSNFIRINPIKDYSIHYDGANCDGLCLKNDCDIASDEARAAIELTKNAPAANRG